VVNFTVFSNIAINANAFASTFYFFSTYNANTEKNKKSLQAKPCGHSKFVASNHQWKTKHEPITSATRQVRQWWFSVGIFPPGLLFGLTGNRPQSAPACSFLRYGAVCPLLETVLIFERFLKLKVQAV